MIETFWTIATSDLALAIVGGLFLASLAIAHLPFVRMMPSLEPYVVAAGLVSYLLLADLALCIGHRISDEHAEVERLQNEVNWNSNQLEQQKATADDAERIAREKAGEAEELKGKVADYETALEKASAHASGDACALTDDDIARLRSLSRRAKKR